MTTSTDPRRWRRLARVGLVAPLVLAAALAGAAVFTVEQAGCDDPSAYVLTPHGLVLDRGCDEAPGPRVPGTVPSHGGASDQADARRG